MTEPATTQATRVLVIEDNPKVARMLHRGLTDEKYAVDTVPDGKEGLTMAQAGNYDLLIVDVMLPGMNGFELTKSYRNSGGTTPILMLTAKTATDDKVAGLDSGADDYLTKPFAFSELLARMRSLFRRGGLDKNTILTFADLELDTVSHKAKRSGKPIELTAKEYALLEFFLRNQGSVLSRSIISEHIWDYSFDTGTNLIDVYINHLRAKIEAGFPGKLIHTVRGVGYVLREE
ncbi:MAG TPA: response regulator transcription factor [Bacteroidota bacterium]|nr:response regulator transcription factor [Bacteroidota bacterium]